MKFKIQNFIAFALIVISLFLIYSCKKGDKQISSEDSEKELQSKIAKAKAWMSAQKHKIIHPLNQQLDNFQIDENGNRIPFRPGRGSATGAGCFPVSNPSALINNWSITDADCNNDTYYQVIAEFTVSSENAVVYDNPNNSSQHTYGRILVRNSSNQLIFSKEDIPVTITDLGIDPNNLAARKYKITWTNTSLATSLVNGSNTMRLGLYYYTECEEESRYSYAPVTNWFNIGSATECNVVSPVFLDPQGHSVLGVSACTCCNPEIVPASHKVIFSRPGFTSATKTLGVTEVWFPTTSQIPQGYTYTVTYWNVGTNGCEGPPYSTSIYW